VGVLAPRYFIVDVVINGNKLGIMALEEHFDKELLESSGRPEGVILRFDESLVWAARAARARAFDDRVFLNYQNAPIDAFRSSRIARSQRLSEEYGIAVGLLRGFSSRQLSASDAFDADLLGRFLAVAEFWGTAHGIVWHNLRFYFNPITAKLEPIGFNAELVGRPSQDAKVCRDEPIVAAMFEDSAIFDVYRRTLQQLAEEMTEGSLEDVLRKVEQQYLAVLHREFYFLDNFPLYALKTRANHLASRTAEELRTPTISEGYPVLIHAYRLQDDSGPYLELSNAVPHMVEVLSARWVAPKGGDPSLEFRPFSSTAFPLRLTPTLRGSSPRAHRIRYRPPPSGEAARSLEVIARIPGQEALSSATAEPYHSALTRHPVPVSTVDEQLASHPFLSLDSAERELHVRAGSWPVRGSLIVPDGYSLTIPKGTTLQFDVDAGLFAYGPLHFLGTADRPIVLEGMPAAREGADTWQGVAVLNAGEASRWEHVEVRNTTGVSRSNWKLNGGVTFYQSDVSLHHCLFQGNQAEDALNIVRGKFELNHVRVLDALSDGLDADFARGTVEMGLFEHIGRVGGGDAIDVSGSVVEVNGTRFLDISDKALSVGEQSEMIATEVIIEQVGTGAASKDGSRLDISRSSIKQARNAGLMAYTKKPEFGPARIEAREMTFTDTASEARAQKGSFISIDGTSVEGEDVDVEQLYETVMKPGLRR
jgi:hypothetical protein